MDPQSRQKLLEIIQQSLREVAPRINPEEFTGAEVMDFRLLGNPELDSLKIASLVIRIEDRLNRQSPESNSPIRIMSSQMFSQTKSPLLRVKNLVDYIWQLQSQGNDK